MKRAGGRSVQGYNAQVVASPEQVIIAAQLTQSHNDSDQLAPMVARAAETLREADIQEPIGIVLADGGYWNSPAITNVREQGVDVLIPTQDRRRTRPRRLSPRQGGEAQRIEAVLSQAEGQALYRRRQQIVEPVFAHTKFIRRTYRFLRRGLAACQADWQLIAATHNLLNSGAPASLNRQPRSRDREPPDPGGNRHADPSRNRTRPHPATRGAQQKAPLRGFVQ